MIIGGAWIKETKNGEKFFSCSIDLPFLGKMNFAIFKIKEKKGKGPDYQITWNPQKNVEGAKVSNPFNDEDVPI